MNLSQDQSDFRVIFVPSEIDELGLSAAQFRVYGHLARRAGKNDAYPGIPSIARICKLHEDTVRASLILLRQWNLISVTTRPGMTNLYRLTRPSEWKTPLRNESPTSVSHPSETNGGHPSESDGPHPSETRGYEGSPRRKSTKGTPVFVRPQREELASYMIELELPPTEVEAFLDYYCSNGWKVGKSSMKDWRAAVRNWKRNMEKNNHHRNGATLPSPNRSKGDQPLPQDLKIPKLI
jgi:hypothetical protein